MNGYYIQKGAWTASSLHKGLVNVLMADGHVVAVEQTIDLNVRRSLSTRAGGDETGDY